MTDKLKQAILHITYACTHHCPMCYANASSNEDHPAVEQLYRVVDKLVSFGINDITLVGGDPALYPNILELVQYIKTKNVRISILSNTLDFSGNNQKILEFVDVFEGTFHHSLKQKYDAFCQCKGAFDKLLENLSFFASHGKSIGIAVNLIPFNFDVVYDIVSNIINNKHISLDHIVLQRIIQFGRAVGSYNYELSTAMIETIMKQIEQAERDFGINVIFEDPLPVCSIDKKYKKYMHPCEWGITKVSVDFNGNLSRCGADVFHTFGSIFDDNIVDKWKTNESLALFRNKKYLPSTCLECEDFYICGGGCPISRNPEKGFSKDYLAQK